MLHECFTGVGHRSLRSVGKFFFNTGLNYPTRIVGVSYECQTPTRVEQRDTPNHTLLVLPDN
jgi:hypothetical protein